MMLWLMNLRQMYIEWEEWVLASFSAIRPRARDVIISHYVIHKQAALTQRENALEEGVGRAAI